MRRIWAATLAVLATGLLAGCGVGPSGITDAGQPPTGVAPGVTLYFVDARHRLRPQLRRTSRLGTISEAMTLLLEGPGGTGMHTQLQVAPGSPTRVVVDTTPGLIRLQVPLARTEVTPLGIDQIVCTTLGVWVQSGGVRTARVQVRFTLPTPESDRHRTCPLIT